MGVKTGLEGYNIYDIFNVFGSCWREYVMQGGAIGDAKWSQIFEGAPGVTVHTLIYLKSKKQNVSLPKLVCFHLTCINLHT